MAAFLPGGDGGDVLGYYQVLNGNTPPCIAFYQNGTAWGPMSGGNGMRMQSTSFFGINTLSP